MADDDWPELGWADSAEAMTIALTKDVSDVAVRSALVIDPEPGFRATFSEALDRQDHAGDSYIVQVDQVGDWQVLIEPNGFLLSMQEISAPLSRDGQLIAAFWNVNSLMTFMFAVNGRVLREFDPLLYAAGGDALPEEAGLPFGRHGRPRVATLALILRMTGVTLTADWLLRKPRETLVSRFQLGTLTNQ